MDIRMYAIHENAFVSLTSRAQRLEFYYMINYYYKYLELLDTVFLALKKKPLRSTFPQHNSRYTLTCPQNSCMCTTTRQLVCFVTCNSMARPAWYAIVLLFRHDLLTPPFCSHGPWSSSTWLFTSSCVGYQETITFPVDLVCRLLLLCDGWRS
jgi:hypothetical protein